MSIIIPRDNITGDYQLSWSTGSVGAGAAAKLIFAARNADTSKLVHITRVQLDGIIATTAFAAGQILAQLFIARNMTNDGSGGGTLTLTGINANLKRQMPACVFGPMRVATSAALTAPSWVLDSNPVGQINTHSSGGVAAATPIIGSQYLPNDGILFYADEASEEHPITLGANEGIGIVVTVPATGVWIAGGTMKWKESNPY